MTDVRKINARLEALLAGAPVTGDSLDGDLSTLISQIDELVPEPVISQDVAVAHLAKIVETAASLKTRPVVAPARASSPGWRAKLSSVSATPARKIAAATLSVSAAFSGLAYAGALPDPIQRVAANIASSVGVTIPNPDVITDGDGGPDDAGTAPGNGGEGRRDGEHRRDRDRRGDHERRQDGEHRKDKGDKDKPGKPDESPGKPDDPGKPDESPGKPDDPGKPEVSPGKPDDPGKPDKDKPEKDKPEKDHTITDKIEEILSDMFDLDWFVPRDDLGRAMTTWGMD